MNVNLILRLEALAFSLYGLAFFLIPDVINGDLFGWEGTTGLFARIIGAAYIGLALIGWRLTGLGEVDPTVVWGFALVPIGVMIAFIWERAAGTYNGPDFYFWFNLGVTVLFVVLVGGAAIAASRRTM